VRCVVALQEIALRLPHHGKCACRLVSSRWCRAVGESVTGIVIGRNQLRTDVFSKTEEEVAAFGRQLGR
jgi:hypothetical protein